MPKRRKLVVSDAALLIQLALSHNLDVLPSLYNVIIPKGVFDETQHYSELPDAIEIARAAGKWLAVMTVQNKKRPLLNSRKGVISSEKHGLSCSRPCA